MEDLVIINEHLNDHIEHFQVINRESSSTTFVRWQIDIPYFMQQICSKYDSKGHNWSRSNPRKQLTYFQAEKASQAKSYLDKRALVIKDQHLATNFY